MKKLLFIFTLFSFTISNGQEGISFFEGSFEEAIALADKEQKIIFIDAYASWCGPCKMMSRDVFTKAEVGEFYNENFINLKIDMEKGEGPKLKRKYAVNAYPTLLFINSKGELIYSAIGYHKPNSFIDVGKTVLKK